jgi:muramoyltetrapeptide carboxypeptidase LdcA involved in peptidoglycan recycling
MKGKRRVRRIHLTAVGSPARNELDRLGVRTARALVEMAQRAVGERYRVTANGRLIFTKENDERGGRSDDAERAREITRVLADDDVAALVTLRGGGWFARVLDAINWDVLNRRRRMIHLFGFSEMTPLIAIAGGYPKAVGVYDLGPGFLFGGMKRYAGRRAAERGPRP